MRKVVQLRPWGDVLDHDHWPHIAFKFFWLAVQLPQYLNCLLSRCKTCLMTFRNCCIPQAYCACCFFSPLPTSVPRCGLQASSATLPPLAMAEHTHTVSYDIYCLIMTQIFGLMSPVSFHLSHVSWLKFPVSHLLSHISCLKSHISCLKYLVLSLLSHVSSIILFYISCLLSLVSHLLCCEQTADFIGNNLWI